MVAPLGCRNRVARRRRRWRLKESPCPPRGARKEEEEKKRERERERENAEMYIRFNEPRQREREENEADHSPASPAKFRPREQNNKFILAVVAAWRRVAGGIRNAVLAWILPARPSVSEQRIPFHFPKAHHGHKFHLQRATYTTTVPGEGEGEEGPGAEERAGRAAAAAAGAEEEARGGGWRATRAVYSKDN